MLEKIDSSNSSDLVDKLERAIMHIVDAVTLNGNKPGCSIPFLPEVASVLHEHGRFDKAKLLYNLSLDLALIFGSDALRVEEINLGMRGCDLQHAAMALHSLQ